VTWTDESGEEHEGVYIPRRDTGSRLNALVGGRFFPGEHHRAYFQVRDDARTIDLVMESADGSADVRLRVQMSDRLPPRRVSPRWMPPPRSSPRVPSGTQRRGTSLVLTAS